MKVVSFIIFLPIILLFLSNTVLNSDVVATRDSGIFIRDVIRSSPVLQKCTLFLPSSSTIKKKTFIQQLSSSFPTVIGNPIFNTTIKESLFPFKWGYSTIKRNHQDYCVVIVIILKTTSHFKAIPVPGFVKKDKDYFILVGATDNLLESTLLNSAELRFGIKHVVGITLLPKLVAWRRLFCFRCGVENSEVMNEITWGNNYTEFRTAFTKELLHNPTRNLGGASLKISTPIYSRWLNEMTYDPSGAWVPRRGLYALAFSIVEKSLNFTSTFIPSSGGGTGRLINGKTWIGTVGDVLYGKADFGQATANTYGRFGVVAHSFPISQTCLTFSTGLPKPYYSWKGVYLPLGKAVWRCVGVSTFISWGMLIFLVKRESQIYGDRNGQNRWTFCLLGEYVLATLLEQDPPSPAKRNSNTEAIRTFTIFWLIFCIIISTAYRSQLVTFLAFPNVESPPESFEELAQSKYAIGLQYIKGAALEFLRSSKNPTYSAIFKKMSLEEDDVNCFVKAVKSRFACISWDSIADFVKNRNLTDRNGRSSVMRSSACTFSINAGLVMGNDAIFKESIDNVLKRITDAGIMIKLLDLDIQFIRKERLEWEKVEGGNQGSDTGLLGENKSVALNLTHFMGSFYIFLAFIIFSCIYFCGELFKYYFSKHCQTKSRRLSIARKVDSNDLLW